MKKNLLILFTLLVACNIAVYYFWCSDKTDRAVDNEKSIDNSSAPIVEQTPVEDLISDPSEQGMISGYVLTSEPTNVSFLTDGKLIPTKKQLAVGSTFKKGEIIFKLDNEHIFFELTSLKTELQKTILNSLNGIKQYFPDEHAKWKSFVNELDPGKLLPELPSIKTTEEKNFLLSRNVIPEYYKVKKLEAEIALYFYAAPYNGKVISIQKRTGDLVKKNQKVAEIAANRSPTVIFSSSSDQYEAMRNDPSNWIITSDDGDALATIKLIETNKQINPESQKLELHITPNVNTGKTLREGQKVKVMKK